MLLTRNQFLIILCVLIASCGAWAILLKMFLDSSLALKWSLMVWFFGGCFVAAFVVGVYIRFIDDNKKERRISDRKVKIDGDINPMLIAMRHKLTEVKQAAKKGIDHE